MKQAYRCCFTRQPTTELHHVFFGRGKRKVCDKFMIKVPVIPIIHDFAHGRSLQGLHLVDRFFDRAVTRDGIQDMMAKRFCKEIGIDYDETNRHMNMYFDALTANKQEATLYLEGVQEKCVEYLQRCEA